MGNDISEFKVRGKSSSLLKTSEYSPKPSSPHARYRERKFTRETLVGSTATCNLLPPSRRY